MEQEQKQVSQSEQISPARVVVFNDDTGQSSRQQAKLTFGFIKRVLFTALGFIFFGLGAVGAFLPILPTTPFLLLSIACFSRSSQRFDNWVKNTKLYKKYLESFVQDRSMTLKTKISLCIFASTMLIIAFIAVDNLHARILIAAVILFKYWYFIFRIRTIKGDEVPQK